MSNTGLCGHPEQKSGPLEIVSSTLATSYFVSLISPASLSPFSITSIFNSPVNENHFLPSQEMPSIFNSFSIKGIISSIITIRAYFFESSFILSIGKG